MRFAAWLLACVLLVGGAGFLLFAPNDARAQKAALDGGSARKIEAVFVATMDHRPQRRVGKPDRHQRQWLGRCRADVEGYDWNAGPAFNVPGRGEILHDWSGKAVTCYLWTDDSVIAVRGPDGSLVERQGLGWSGVMGRWMAALVALGAALVIAGWKLRLGTAVAVIGGVAVALGALGGLHLRWLWAGLGVDLLIVLGMGAIALAASKRDV